MVSIFPYGIYIQVVEFQGLLREFTRIIQEGFEIDRRACARHTRARDASRRRERFRAEGRRKKRDFVYGDENIICRYMRGERSEKPKK